MRKLSHAELVTRQAGNLSGPRLPFCAVLNNIRSLYNVGSIFRTADGVGVEKLWLCGVTGTPDGTKTRIGKTALGAEKAVPWEHRGNIVSLLKELKAKNYQIALLEQAESSVPYQEFIPEAPVCLVVGNEISGVSDEILSLADKAIEIEMAGLKNSLNVTVAFGVVAYHFRNCLVPALESDRFKDKAVPKPVGFRGASA